MTVYILMEQTPGETGGNPKKVFATKSAANEAAKSGAWFYVEEVEGIDLFDRSDLDNVVQGALY